MNPTLRKGLIITGAVLAVLVVIVAFNWLLLVIFPGPGFAVLRLVLSIVFGGLLGHFGARYYYSRRNTHHW
jgi:hypothetical protein